MAKQNIEKLIDTKIKTIEGQIRDLQVKLDEWQKISNDYQVNKTTIESILGLHDAPNIDGSLPVKKTRTKRDLNNLSKAEKTELNTAIKKAQSK